MLIAACDVEARAVHHEPRLGKLIARHASPRPFTVRPNAVSGERPYRVAAAAAAASALVAVTG